MAGWIKAAMSLGHGRASKSHRGQGGQTLLLYVFRGQLPSFSKSNFLDTEPGHLHSLWP